MLPVALGNCSRPRWACPSGTRIDHYGRSVSDENLAFPQSPPGPPGRAATAEIAKGPRDGVLGTNPSLRWDKPSGGRRPLQVRL